MTVEGDQVGDVTSDKRGSGARYNAGKVEYGLIPLVSLKWAAQVLMFGREKYAEWNWTKGMKWSVPYNCMLRHMDLYQQGEWLDEESGLPHLGHILCNAIMLNFFAMFYPEGDDRPDPSMFESRSEE